VRIFCFAPRNFSPNLSRKRLPFSESRLEPPAALFPDRVDSPYRSSPPRQRPHQKARDQSLLKLRGQSSFLDTDFVPLFLTKFPLSVTFPTVLSALRKRSRDFSLRYFYIFFFLPQIFSPSQAAEESLFSTKTLLLLPNSPSGDTSSDSVLASCAFCTNNLPTFDPLIFQTAPFKQFQAGHPLASPFT